MRIVLNTEIAIREIDANLLLSCILAGRGHDVLVSEQSNLNFLVRFKFLPPSVFFTKSLHAAPSKVSQNRDLVARGTVIVSHDQESMVAGGTEFALGRFAPESVGLASRIFCWGPKDYELLSSQYPKQIGKFVVSGSPRLDLCRPDFEPLWPAVHDLEKAGFILVCTSFTTVMGTRSLWSDFQTMREMGMMKLSPALVGRYFEVTKSEAALLGSFFSIIGNLSETFPERLIVVRPHPTESEEGWDTLLSEFPNVIVDGSGGPLAMIHQASVVIQSGSTLGVEAHLAGKPVISVEETHGSRSSIVSRAASTAGLVCLSTEQVAHAVKSLFDGNPDPGLYNWGDDSSFHRPQGGLASSVIADEIMSLNTPALEGKFRFWSLWLAVLIRQLVIYFLKSMRMRETIEIEDSKFRPLSRKEIRRKVAWLSKHLGVNHLEVIFFPDKRGFLLKSKNGDGLTGAVNAGGTDADALL